MKMIRIIATILVSVSMAFIFACSEEKTASLEGNEDIAAVLQKLPECLNNLEIINEIYTDDALLKYQDRHTGKMNELSGSKAIGKVRKEIGINESWTKVSINKIDRKADIAHVNYKITTDNRGNVVVFNGSGGMVKQGQTWKIKEETIKWR
jgi:hypothetical protein